MTKSRIKASLLIVFLLILFSCSTDARELVVKERFIYNRVIAHYYVSIEKYNGNGCVRDSIDKWLDLVVNDHLRWAYYADSTTPLRYDSKDFATQYRKWHSSWQRSTSQSSHFSTYQATNLNLGDALTKSGNALNIHLFVSNQNSYGHFSTVWAYSTDNQLIIDTLIVSIPEECLSWI